MAFFAKAISYYRHAPQTITPVFTREIPKKGFRIYAKQTHFVPYRYCEEESRFIGMTTRQSLRNVGRKCMYRKKSGNYKRTRSTTSTTLPHRGHDMK